MTRSWFIRIAAMVALGGASILLRVGAEAEQSDLPLRRTRYTISPEYLRIAALSHDALVADVLWIRFVQEIPLRPADEDLGTALANQLAAIVALDPTFRSAYLQGGILLSVLGAQPCAALQVLEQGMERYPDDWRIPFQAGYNCFVELGDPACGARHMERAASLPGSPDWLPALAARLMADANEDTAAIEYLQVQLARTTDPKLRERFTERLREALLSRDLRRIAGAARRYRLTHDGRTPPDLEALVRAGLLPADMPRRDPFGGEYRILPNGTAATTSGRAPLHAFGSHSAFMGTIAERLVVQRVVHRLPRFLGKPAWVRTSVDAVAMAAPSLEGSLQGLETALQWTHDPVEVENLRVAQARTLLRLELDRLREAQLAILRERPSAIPSLQEIRARAEVPVTDPFGSEYVIAADGLPGPATGRNPMIAIRSSGGSNRCR